MQAHFHVLDQDRLTRERVALAGALFRAITMTIMLAVLGEFVLVSESQANRARTVYTQVDQQIFGTRSAPAQGQPTTQLAPP